MDEWLAQARDAVAEAAGMAPAELTLEDADVQTLLDVARLAAHESGQRVNAPLLTFLLGRASTRAELERLVAAVRALA